MFQFSGSIGSKNNVPHTRKLTLSDSTVFRLHIVEGAAIEVSNGTTHAFIFSVFFQYKEKTGQPALSHFLTDYSNSGQQALQHLRGQFVVLLVDTAINSLTVATDKLGTTPLYYSKTQAGLNFSSHLQPLVSQLDQKPSINTQSIYNYVFHHCIPAPYTIYENVFKMECSELVSWNNNTLNKETYFIPTFSNEKINEQTAQDELIYLLEASVKDRIANRDNNKVGAFLSGGLDSSTVSGMLSKSLGYKGAKTFTIGFDAKGYDESAYAKITADHFKTDHHVYYVTPNDVESSLQDIASYYDEPFGNSSALPAYYCAKFAKEHGVNTMLAGDGGDELFAGNERYAKQKIFELYYKVPAPLRKLLLDLPLSNVSDSNPIPLLSKAASYVRQAKIKLPDRLYTYNFLHQIDPSSVFTDGMLSSINQGVPISEVGKRYDQLNDADSLSRMLYLDWKFTLADNDLVKVNNMCHKAGVDVLYPMLDDRLIELATRVPSNIKLPGNKLRDYYKASTKPFLPEATINKSKQGFGLPFGVWMQTNKSLRDMAYDNVLALKSTNYFEEDFLNNALKLHQSGEASSYYGELVWILSMLNMWLEKH